jgi:hypothetical protein
MSGVRDAENDALAEAFFDIESSPDRAAGIVAAAFVEDRVAEAIKSRLHSDKALIDYMFRGSGPLGSFAAKIDLAFSMGLCSKDMWKDLTAIRKIRNEFAHNVLVASFETDRIRDLANNLTIGERINVTLSAVEPDGKNYVVGPADKPKTPRERFIRACEMLIFILPVIARQLPPPATPPDLRRLLSAET